MNATGVLIPFRLAVQQRVLPSYRAAFFDALAAACKGGLGLFAGLPRAEEAIEPAGSLKVAHDFPAHNRHLLSGGFYLCWQGGFIRWLESWQPDALIVEANPRYLSTARAVRWMHTRGRPVIGWGLGAPVPRGPLAGLRQAVRRRFLSQFEALLAYSRQGAEQYIQAGFPPEKVVVAPNAAVPCPSKPPPERPQSFPAGQATLIFVGRLQARKRVDLLLRACGSLPEDMRPRLWIVGDGPARPELEALARQVYPSAQFLGARRGVDLESLFTAADLFVLPGTGGLAVQQAMSFALPVIVAEGDGTQMDLVRPANGWQVAPGSLDALVSALQEGLSDASRLRRMGRESFRVVSEEVNLEKMVTAFAKAVEIGIQCTSS